LSNFLELPLVLLKDEKDEDELLKLELYALPSETVRRRQL